MSEPLKVSAVHNATRPADVDDFYVRRINWLVTVGRADLIDEIADDCERRRTAPPAADPSAAMRAAGSPPMPVETGTRLAVARLRRARPALGHVRESQSISG